VHYYEQKVRERVAATLSEGLTLLAQGNISSAPVVDRQRLLVRAPLMIYTYAAHGPVL
jgi:hypothetical protein